MSDADTLNKREIQFFTLSFAVIERLNHYKVFFSGRTDHIIKEAFEKKLKISFVRLNI